MIEKQRATRNTVKNKKGVIGLVAEVPFLTRMRREMEHPLQNPEPAAVIAIRPLCIKHTFVESRDEIEEEDREMERNNWVNSSQRSIWIISLPLFLPLSLLPCLPKQQNSESYSPRCCAASQKVPKWLKVWQRTLVYIHTACKQLTLPCAGYCFGSRSLPVHIAGEQAQGSHDSQCSSSPSFWRLIDPSLEPNWCCIGEHWLLDYSVKHV